MQRFLPLLAISFLFIQCHQRDTTPEQEENQSLVTLTAVQDNLLLMDKAGTEGNIIQQLPYGTLLSYLNEISDFTTELTINNITFNDPWLKVQLQDSETIGWVYSGGVKFNTKGEGKALAKQVINKRLGNYFGIWCSQQIETYQTKYKEAETALELSEAFQIGVRLRDSMNVKLNQLDISENQEIPDLFWIDEPLPALQPTNVDNGAIFHLFFNYKELMEKAKQTIGEADDAFVELCYLVYSVDSIEYFYPSWRLPISEFQTVSLFGEGKHFAILKQIQEISNQGNFFYDFEVDIKYQVLRDISNENLFWLPKEKLIAELDSIFKSNLVIFNKDDRVEIHHMFDVFETPEKFEIQVNLREEDSQF